MTIDKLTYEWADTGTKTPAPSDEKIQEGFVGGDKAPIEYFNWLFNRNEKVINDLIRERINSFYESATNPQKMITTGIWDDDWKENDYVYNGVATSKIVDIAVYFTTDNEPRLLALDQATHTINVFNPRTLALLDTSSDLTDDLKASKTYTAQSFCTDGTYVYCAFANATDTTIDVQCWQISDWSVRTGWAATGTNMGSTSTITAQRCAKIFIADDDFVCCVRGGKAVVDSSTEIMSMFDRTDGSIDSEGAGDCPATFYPAWQAACSDGTNIIFGANDATPDSRICSATIADLTAGTGGANYPLTMAGYTVYSMICIGNGLCVSSYLTNGGQANTSTVLRTHNASDADLDVIISGDSCHATPITQATYCGTPSAMCYDGINLYIASRGTNAGGNSTHNITKIDAQKLMGRDVDAGEERSFFDIITGVYNIADGMTFGSSSYLYSTVFDGRDVWTIPDSTASADTSGRVYRLPLALFRT